MPTTHAKDPAQEQPSLLFKTATTALGIAIYLNDKRKQSKKKMLEKSQLTTAELIERGSEVDRKLKNSANHLVERTQQQLQQGVQTSQQALHKVQTSLEEAADTRRDQVLRITGVATHKDVKHNAKVGHINALATKMVQFNESIDYQLKEHREKLAHKADRRDLAPLAKSEDLTPLATSQELAGLAKAEQLQNLVKRADLDRLATSQQLETLARTEDLALLDKIPLLTEKVDLLAHKEDLFPIAKEASVKALQNILSTQLDTHQTKIELLMTQLATRSDISDITDAQATKQDVQHATQKLASKNDVESIVKQLIKHIQGLEEQVSYLKNQLDNQQAPLAETVLPKTQPSGNVSDAIDSVQLRAS
ncbi:hypothetical protein [Litoribacillus peritrichatus]|uniref:Uncharacterized protein n=1 Tax=Litoribacillus peritrichatus TaxID=718191 RepID=A0ABP7MHR5_9GAMM